LDPNYLHSGKKTNSLIYQSHFSHELVAGAASFAAFKAFEDRQRAEGMPVDHAFAKAILAGFAGDEVDRLWERHGLDFLDYETARSQAIDNTAQMYDDYYGGYDMYDPNVYEVHETFNLAF
jgi:hypothetical protein